MFVVREELNNFTKIMWGKSCTEEMKGIKFVLLNSICVCCTRITENCYETIHKCQLIYLRIVLFKYFPGKLGMNFVFEECWKY